MFHFANLSDNCFWGTWAGLQIPKLKFIFMGFFPVELSAGMFVRAQDLIFSIREDIFLYALTVYV